MTVPISGNEHLPPQPPEKPFPSDCCGGGCARCVFDIYEDALERYERALEQWQAREFPWQS